MTSEAARTVVDAPGAPIDHAAAVKPPRRLAPFVAGGVLLLLLVVSAAGWLAWKRAQGRGEERVGPVPEAVAPAPPAPAAPRVEAISYWVETFENGEGETGERVAELTTALGPAQTFRFHLTPRTRGYLYLVGHKGQENALVTMLTARGGRGLRSNAVLDGDDFTYPRPRGMHFILRGEAGAVEGYTVIFSPTPLVEPAFLAADFERDLTHEQLVELEALRRRAPAPVLEVRGEGASRRVAVNVPEGTTEKGEPVIFDIRLMRR